MRHTADWWAERLVEVDASGNAQAVARRYGLRVKTLNWWRSELRRRARPATKQRLLPVVVKTPPTSPLARGLESLEVLVEVGAARVTVRGAVTPEHLAAIVSSARAC